LKVLVQPGRDRVYGMGIEATYGLAPMLTVNSGEAPSFLGRWWSSNCGHSSVEEIAETAKRSPGLPCKLESMSATAHLTNAKQIQALCFYCAKALPRIGRIESPPPWPSPQPPQVARRAAKLWILAPRAAFRQPRHIKDAAIAAMKPTSRATPSSSGIAEVRKAIVERPPATSHQLRPKKRLHHRRQAGAL